MNIRDLNAIIICISVAIFGGCKKLDIEHEEARNIEIKEIDFSKLKNGEHNGYYAGGMYGWRENECLVTVDSNKVTAIGLVRSKSEYTQQFIDTLYNRVIRKQSLMVDAVSGATLDSKACLKAIENALVKAVQDSLMIK